MTTLFGKLKRSMTGWTAFDVSIITIAWTYVALRVLRSAVGFDDVIYSTPAQQVTLDAWRHGRMSLWSTTTFGGTPQLGNMQLGGLYPLHWLAAPFPDLLGTDIELVAHVLLIGFGFYILGRRLHLSRPAPLVMAVSAMWVGATMMRAPLLVHLPPLAWAPWAAICTHAVITSAQPRRATALLAVVVWLIVVSGHPQSILMSATLLVAWAAGLLIEHHQWRRAGHLATAGALALIAAAPALFGALRGISAAASSTRDASALLPSLYVMPLRGFPRLLLGQPMSDVTLLLGQSERITYAGATVVALSIVGAVAAIRARRWSYVALLTVGIFAASLSLGLRSPTMRFARAFLPGFDQPRVSARWNWVLVMALIVLAGVGVDRLSRHRARPEGLAVIAAAAGFALVTPLGIEHGGTPNNLLWVSIVALVVLIAFVSASRTRVAAAALLTILAVVELAVPISWFIKVHDHVSTSTNEFVGPGELWLAQQPGLTLALTNEGFEPFYLVQGMRPNANTIVGVRSIDGYDGGTAISRRWHAGLLQVIPTISDLTFRAQLQYPIEQDAMARLGVHYVMWDPTRGPVSEALPGWRMQPVGGRFEIYENTLWKGDAIVWYATELVSSPEDAGDRLRLDTGALDQVGLVEDASAVLSCSGECTADGFVTRSEYSGRREVNVVAAHPAIVAIHEQYDEGWTVYVDGHEEAVIPVDGIWSGVAVTAGSHHIELRYEPGWLWPSLWTMLIGWVAIVGLLFWPQRADTNTAPER